LDLIILNDGFYSLVPVTKIMLEDIKLVAEVNCFQLCDILRIKLSTYVTDPLNAHVMNDGSGDFFGCMCK
jgi:NADP-dependent 3-hydroxy acid dehydrogenase YdfG